MIFHQPFNSRTNYNFNTAFYTNEVWNYHFHRNLELIWVLKGAVKCTVNSREYTLEEDELGLCLPCDVHRYEPGEHTRYFVLVFSEDYVRSFTNLIAGKIGDGFSFRVGKALGEYLRCRLLDNRSLTTFTLKSCLYGICEEYLAAVTLVAKNHKDEEDTFSRITEYILAHHTKQISLADIARVVGYDYAYTSRFFRKTFNMTFSEYVGIHRIETAIRLLEDTDESITDIAYGSGFQSLRSFNGFFKKQMGITPSEYRRMHPSGLVKVSPVPPFGAAFLKK